MTPLLEGSERTSLHHRVCSLLVSWWFVKRALRPGKAMRPEVVVDVAVAIPAEPAIPGGDRDLPRALTDKDASTATAEVRRRYADAIVEACRQRTLVQVDLLDKKYR